MGFAFYPQARPDVETHVLPDGSCLLFDPITCEGLALSIVGALVWDYCDGALAWDDIVSEIAGLTPQEPGVREEVQWFLKEFTQNGLLRQAAEIETVSPGSPELQG
ncbi:MAG: PqqD family peptide modification chaperone [Ktedonobacterales bacterium]